MQFQSQLLELAKYTKPLFSEKFLISDYVPIDLSVNNSALKSDAKFLTADQMEDYIDSYLIGKRAKVAYGGYLEKRDLYAANERFQGTAAEQVRNVHLGLDFWISAGTEIFAPLDGTIHSFANNSDPGNYGPTIIIQHHCGDTEFFTLYGHLCLASIKGIAKGEKISKGDYLGSLGNKSVNGGYAPHLHFQVIRDIQNYEGDYPGVCSKKNLDSFKENCPDPRLLLKI